MASDYTKRAECRITEADDEFIRLLVDYLQHVGIQRRVSDMNPAIKIDRSTVLREAISLGLRELLIMEASRGVVDQHYHTLRGGFTQAAAYQASFKLKEALGQADHPHHEEGFKNFLDLLLDSSAYKLL